MTNLSYWWWKIFKFKIAKTCNWQIYVKKRTRQVDDFNSILKYGRKKMNYSKFKSKIRCQNRSKLPKSPCVLGFHSCAQQGGLYLELLRPTFQTFELQSSDIFNPKWEFFRLDAVEIEDCFLFGRQQIIGIYGNHDVYL